MNGELADMVFGDPPFNLKIAGNVSGLGRIKHREFAEASREMNVQIERVCHNGAIVYWRGLRTPFMPHLSSATAKLAFSVPGSRPM